MILSEVQVWSLVVKSHSMNIKVGGILDRIYPDSRVSSIKKFSKGAINNTYSFKVKSKDFVLRIHSDNFWKIKKEAYMYELIAKKTDIPVPNVVKTGKDYLLITKIKGKEISVNNKKLVRKSGEILAKLHSIKFPSYGWIVGDKIKPSFNMWEDFIYYDVKQKLKKIPSKSALLKKNIKKIVDENKSLLKINSKPCLLHKDYHASHILVHNGAINGIIDIEWAMAGHNELDLAKTSLWMFKNKPELEKIFLQGYKKYGKVSKEFKERQRLYKLLTSFSSLSFSYECRNRKWCIYNLNELEGEINEYH